MTASLHPDSMSPRACGVFSVADLRFALAWSRVAPGFGGWRIAVLQISTGEMVEVTPPGASFAAFCALPRTGYVELVQEGSMEDGGGQVTVAQSATLRDALLLLCPLSRESLAEIEAGVGEAALMPPWM